MPICVLPRRPDETRLEVLHIGWTVVGENTFVAKPILREFAVGNELLAAAAREAFFEALAFNGEVYVGARDVSS